MAGPAFGVDFLEAYCHSSRACISLTCVLCLLVVKEGMTKAKAYVTFEGEEVSSRRRRRREQQKEIHVPASF